MVREDFLQQNAFVDMDPTPSYDRQIRCWPDPALWTPCRDAIDKGAPVPKLFAIPARERLGRAKSVPRGVPAGL